MISQLELTNVNSHRNEIIAQPLGVIQKRLTQDKIILNINGSPEIIQPFTLIVFIDETGVETLNDPNAPFFGLGGLVISAKDYFSFVEHPWHELKKEHFGGVDNPLHASDLRSPNNSQIEALNNFFQQNQFGRVAVMCTDKTIFESNFKPEEILAASIWQRIVPVANKMVWNDILVLFEENRRLMPALQKEMMTKTPMRGGTKITVRYGTILKDSSFAGLEVADFIIHTAGRQSRIMRNYPIEVGDEQYKPDFEMVFKNTEFQSFLNITRVVE